MNQSTRVHITHGYAMADNKELNDIGTPDKEDKEICIVGVQRLLSNDLISLLV